MMQLLENCVKADQLSFDVMWEVFGCCYFAWSHKTTEPKKASEHRNGVNEEWRKKCFVIEGRERKNRTIVESEHRTFHYWININMRVFKSNCCITFYPLRWHFPLCHAHTTYFRLPCVIRGLESNSFPTTTFSHSTHTHTHFFFAL